MKAVLITGNPFFIKTDVAKRYYAEIIRYVESLGVEITTDPGAPCTCPPVADFYIGHSRGCDRLMCFDDEPGEVHFLCFGDEGGINHPVDTEWLRAPKGTPPDEHFSFTLEQKQAIHSLVTRLQNVHSLGARSN